MENAPAPASSPSSSEEIPAAAHASASAVILLLGRHSLIGDALLRLGADEVGQLGLTIAKTIARNGSADAVIHVLDPYPALKIVLDRLDADDMGHLRKSITNTIARRGPMRRTVKGWQMLAHEAARTRGFYPGEPHEGTAGGRNVGEVLMLITSELAEALEEWRRPDCDLRAIYAMDPDGKRALFENNGQGVSIASLGGRKPEGFGIELADAVIRILDTAEAIGIDLEAMIDLKMAWNETRSYRHGGKRA
jgi:hypothetical protein